MKDGIYTVAFESSQQSVGEGTVVVQNGWIHGGDIAFTIRGAVKRPVMELEIHHYNREIPSVLGMEEDYWLEVSYCEVGDGHYDFSGHVKGHPDRTLKAYARLLTTLLT
ncbi:TPA: GrlR family regulatory protein [Salmonella enterica subsp. enterica serovar Newport]|nr:nucleoside transporter [Salmonella enterica]EBY2668964.1 nucleoside transporter [Salmonella enterica subsp. enterica serovar Teko]EEA8680249.1 nucleoside transporter [Salmonella enterica subsp. enterica]EFB7478461.1 nucleoside transporter [Salmonella enterica subsp. enterica serovar Newport]EEK2864848.1 nucleoside transporter [Salmonella enterica]